jgi:hypothetical protein
LARLRKSPTTVSSGWSDEGVERVTGSWKKSSLMEPSWNSEGDILDKIRNTNLLY